MSTEEKGPEYQDAPAAFDMSHITIEEAGSWSEDEYQAKRQWLKDNGQENDLKELEKVRRSGKK